MTKDDIIRMAREAANGMPGYTSKVKDPSGAVLGFYERFAALVAAAEREACAKVCEELTFSKAGPSVEARRQRLLCAAAIRARGQE